MIPRERMRKAINYIEPDRVPIDNSGIISGIHEIAYRNLLDYLGMTDEITIYDGIQRLAVVKDEVLDLLGVDTRCVYANASSSWKYEPDVAGNWKDEFGTGYRRCELYCDYAYHPLANATLKDLKQFKMPDAADSARFEGIHERAKKLYNDTDYALVGGSICAIFFFGWGLRGLEQFMMDLTGDKKYLNYLLDMILEWNLTFLDGYLSEVGGYIEYQWLGDDWSDQHGPMISPATFEDFGYGRTKKMVDMVKSKTKAKVCYHSCGSSRWLLPYLIEMGVDIIQPMQANATGNEDAEQLKKEFADKIVFHGNTDNQGLFHKSKEELKADTLYRIKYLAPGGGYIFSSGHNIQANMSPENILTLFETAREFGTYPIDTSRIDVELEKLKTAMNG